MKYVLIALLGLSLLNVGHARGDYGKKRLNKRVHKRQLNQGKRIRHGVKNGELTKGEFKHLAKGQIRVQKYKKKAKKDGQITPKERIIMEKMQNRQSRRIYQAKHNDRSRNGGQVDAGQTADVPGSDLE